MSLTSPPVGQTPPLDQVKPLAKKESPLEVTKRILEEHGVTDFEVLDENNPNGQILIGEETLAICEATKRGQPIVLISMRRQFKDKTLSEKLELACKEIGSQGIEVIICTEAVERPYPTEAEIKVSEFLKELGFTMFNLANNHVLNFGRRGFEQNKNYLNQHQFDFFELFSQFSSYSK